MLEGSLAAGATLKASPSRPTKALCTGSFPSHKHMLGLIPRKALCAGSFLPHKQCTRGSPLLVNKNASLFLAHDAGPFWNDLILGARSQMPGSEAESGRERLIAKAKS